MITFPVYADVESVLVGYLGPLFPSARVVTEIPAQIPAFLIRVERLSGGDLVPGMELPTVDVDCFASTRAGVNVFAAQVRQALHQMPGYTTGQVTVASSLVSNYGWRPYTNTNVRSVGMTTQLTLHNH